MNSQNQPFIGVPSKMNLRSEAGFFGRILITGEEIKQSVSIHTNGMILISRYFLTENHHERRRSTARIDPATAAWLLSRVMQYVSQTPIQGDGCDLGTWNLTITNRQGQRFCYTGAMIESFMADDSLSDILRDSLNRQYLWLFDGNPDRVEVIEVNYRRISKIKLSVQPSETSHEYVTWDYAESLILDRKSETLKYTRDVASGCVITNIYHVQDGISYFLDDIDLDTFASVKGNPADAVFDPVQTEDYEITISTKHGAHRHITGTFDKNGLPDDWPAFIESVWDFISFYGLGELFEKKQYNKLRRRQTDMIFCQVVFDEFGKTYCYLTDDDTLCEGDSVKVPVGDDNHELIARIDSIEYHTAENAPFSIDKIKRIIGKYSDEG